MLTKEEAGIVSASLSGGGMHGIHTGCLWGRASFLPRQPHAGDPQVSKWGWGTPVHPARGPASIFPEDWGEAGRGPSDSCAASAAPVLLHAGHRGLSAWRLECLTRAESGEGMEIPGESTRARRSGRGSHACLGPEPRGVRATRAWARAPSPGPRGKKRRRSHAVRFTFLSEQSHDSTGGRAEDWKR